MIQDLEGLENISSVSLDLIINDNDYSQSLEGLVQLSVIENSLNIINNINLRDSCSLELLIAGNGLQGT
ncbi:MAG: hypothetical protein ACI86C_000451 [Candidatus Latescibacterota bacterium]